MDLESNSAEGQGGFDRRSFIRRSALVGAATVWAAPTIQSLVSPAFATGTQAGGCTSCLTGGGQIVGTTAGPVLFNGAPIPMLSFGLGQLCCEGQGPVEIEVNAHPGPHLPDISWHFTDNLVLTCTKTGNPAPGPGTADCANRFTGTVEFGEDGEENTLTFVFEDSGEPGLVDFVSINITGPQGTLTGTGQLDRGNLQVHEGLGPLTHDCSGC